MYKIEFQPPNGRQKEFGPFGGKSEAEELLHQAGFKLVGAENDRWHLTQNGKVIAVAFVRPLGLLKPSKFAEAVALLAA